jgi:hypothetical protein
MAHGVRYLFMRSGERSNLVGRSDLALHDRVDLEHEVNEAGKRSALIRSSPPEASLEAISVDSSASVNRS